MSAAVQPAHAIVDVQDLKYAYGRVDALRGISLTVNRGEVVAVVGANGAGKTTMLRNLSGLAKPQSGIVEVLGKAVSSTEAFQLAHDGLLLLPEGRGTLTSLTVLDNLRIAYDIRPSDVSFDQALQKVYVRFPRLLERSGQKAGNLSGGEQQMLGLARAVINRPLLLLLDEPSLGLSPLMVTEAYRTLRALKDEGLTILLVEQNVKVALNFADRAYVLRQGRVVRSGSCQELREDPEFVAHYLGTH